MAKKSKQSSDFKKVKIKVGKKLPKNTNLTNTKFKSKRILIKEKSTLNSDPIKALKKNASCNTQFKNLCLEKINENFLKTNCDYINGDTFNILSRLVVDYDKKVRSSAIKSIKQCLKVLVQQNKNIEPVLNIILTYINCGLTHIDQNINYDSKMFVKTILEKYIHSKCKLLTKIMVIRLKSASNLDADDYDLFSIFTRHLYHFQEAKSIMSKVDVNKFQWSPKNFNLDLSQVYKFQPHINFNISFQTTDPENGEEMFQKLVTDMVKKEMNELKKRKNENLILNIHEAKKLISCLEICKLLSIPYHHLKDKLCQVQIVNNNLNLKNISKHQSTINILKNKLNSLIKE